ncbi:MAG: hypothetical protein B6I30_05690 [Desulfobacteraceae bacterium 4572_187]|nr:MAG: hypothetical protein B6I30_05690 [Desulfobacteraceae bacterium 4572_187]
MRGKNLIKLLKALEILSKPEGTTIKQMVTQLAVDRRSVYRLIEVIEDLGFPIYDEKIPFEKEKRWKLEESYLKKLPNMKVPDINLFAQKRGKPFKGHRVGKTHPFGLWKVLHVSPQRRFREARQDKGLVCLSVQVCEGLFRKGSHYRTTDGCHHEEGDLLYGVSFLLR